MKLLGLYMKPIIKSRVRILRPNEYEQLRLNISLEKQTQLDVLLLGGMRYVEAQRLQKNPEWFDGNFIHLPEGAQKKKKRKQRERWIRLNPLAKAKIPYFFEGKLLPNINSWNFWLKRVGEKSGIGSKGLSAKTTRKTWESWLAFYYPSQISLIFLSQGHTDLVSLQHYLNMPFLESDKVEMKNWVEGWI